jgi:hypothetical protein
MYIPPVDLSGKVRFALDARWLVPRDYFDKYRTWYGWVHRSASWTCYEEGDLLVVGPSTKGEQKLTGTACFFLRSDYHGVCYVFSRWGIEEVVSSYRLVPIELCTLLERPDEFCKLFERLK